MKRFIWEPGNGTRYDLVYGPFAAAGKFLLCWMNKGGNGGTSLIWRSGECVNHGHLEEKMNVNAADANGLLLFLESKGHDVGLPEGECFKLERKPRLRLV